MKKKHRKNIFGAGILLLIFFCSYWPIVAAAAVDPFASFLKSNIKKYTDADAEYADRPYIRKLKGSFTGDLRILTYGVVQDPAKSTQNPNNDPVGLPTYIGNLELRPDLYFNTKFLDAAVKPRGILEYWHWKKGKREGEEEWNDEWYINEWLVRLNALDRIFLSYGRENLQWGPSFLYSPSNPFFFDNGRSNPYMEVPGMDFGRLIIVPHMLWTASFIVNTDEGRNTLINTTDAFEKVYAIKIDFTGNQNYASLILSQRDDKNTVGYFGGWTVSDALLIYSEGSMRRGSNALYPNIKEYSLMRGFLETIIPAGSEFRPIIERYATLRELYMAKTREDDSDIYPIVLVGSSYTFDELGTLSLEYMYNSPGYTKNEAELYYSLRGNAAYAYVDMGAFPVLIGQYTLYQTGNTGLRFLRKNYAMLQYYKGNIFNRLDTTLRWTQNIDDGSAQFLGLVSCSLGNRFELFSSGVLNSGKEESEFGTFIDYQLMFGLKYSM
ncbi:MAG: hypothetical protein JW976_08105 [Syntrophaceae bacterium]|nr:hypothetical protein [Syntrophaceae bacterium]